MAANPLQLGQQIVAKSKPTRTLRDLNDFQSHLLPNLTPQQFVDALRSGKKYEDVVPNYKEGDTGLYENMDDAIMGELNMSPREYNELLNSSGAPYHYFEDAMKKWEDWDKAGRPKTDIGDWSRDYYTNYAPNGYLRWYRPEEQWGQADKIHAKNEWEDNYYRKGLKDTHNPYKSGYESARGNWQKTFDEYGDILDPKYKGILDWLDKNKENF